MQINKRKAQTLTELLITGALAIILIGSTIGAFLLANRVYISSIAQSQLQKDANMALEKMIKGKAEGSSIFRLSEATKFTIPKISELHFWGTDNVERWYYLNNTGMAILYSHPGHTGSGSDVIYTAPKGASIALRFWPHPVTIPPGDVYTNIDVCLGVTISQNLLGKNIGGSVTTMVNIRNHPTR